jgi:hypothetical protein
MLAIRCQKLPWRNIKVKGAVSCCEKEKSVESAESVYLAGTRP